MLEVTLYLRAALRYALEAAQNTSAANGIKASFGQRRLNATSTSLSLIQQSMVRLLHAYNAARETFGPHSTMEDEALMEKLWKTYITGRPTVPWSQE